MNISETLLPEFDHEMANTRKSLERVPDQKLAWTPHAKSWRLGQLATHLAMLPSWAVYTIKQDSVDIAPAGEPVKPPVEFVSSKELLDAFDKNVADARAAIAGATDSQLLSPWSLLSNGKTLMTMPKAACLRTWVMNHMIHHRAQLGVYLRLSGIPVPAIYGPSADEGGM
jgi:uncharacterized damage-inducible protein DinB